MSDSLAENLRPVVIANPDLVAPRDDGFSLEPGHYGHLLMDTGISAVRFCEYKLSASRWVVLAMAACPDDVPWHRVVNSQGKLSHRSEAGKQKQLLEREGVLFSIETLDLNEYQWLVAELSDKPKKGQNGNSQRVTSLNNRRTH